jgi:hypothetical protein
MKRHIAIVLLISMASLLLTGFQRNETIMARRRSSIASLYYGAGCNGTSTNTCTTSGTTLEWSNSFQYGNPITTGSDASGYTVQACGIYNAGTTGSLTTMQCAIYAAASPSSPVSGCVSSASSANAAYSSWVENTHFSGCTLAASTSYYLFFQSAATTTGFERTYNTGATEYYHTSTYGTWASTLTWSTNANQLFNAYVRVTAN